MVDATSVVDPRDNDRAWLKSPRYGAGANAISIEDYALVWLRRQRVQILTRTESLPTCTTCLWRLGRKVRLVRGAFRTQRPECWWRMLRPKVVPFPQTAQIAGMDS